MNYVELLSAAAPETMVVLAAFAVLAVGLFAMRDVEPAIRRLIEVMIGCVGCTAAIGWMVALPQHTDLLGGIFVVDSVIQVVKIALLTLTILALLISQDSDFTKHVGEYFALILMAAAGMMFLVSSEDILFIFVSLELTSLCLYVLAAFNKGQEQSAEAAIKYFLFGGMSAAFTLFGLSLLYGLAHSTNLAEIAVAVRSAGLDPLVVLGIVMTLVGFGFKVAAAPFHLWAPDVYQGAPLPSAAFIASGSKVAGFFITARVVSTGFADRKSTRL